jgi:hypothetical protein
MRPLSLDLRERILCCYDEKEGTREELPGRIGREDLPDPPVCLREPILIAWLHEPQNQGAESTLAFLLSLAEMRRTQDTVSALEALR